MTDAEAGIANDPKGTVSRVHAGTLEFHALAQIFPMPSEAELSALAADIADHGQRDRIHLFEGRILDGRCRYLACLKADVDPQFEDFTGDDPLSFVVSRNLLRRHLSESQRAMVAAKIANLKVGANQHSEGLPIGKASEQMNVSTRSTARAREVLRSGSPALVAAVETGEMTVSAAAARMRKPEVLYDNGTNHAADNHANDASGVFEATLSEGLKSDGELAGAASEEFAECQAHPFGPYSFRHFSKPGVTIIIGNSASALMPVASKIAATVTAGDYWPDLSRSDVNNIVWLSGQPHAQLRLRSQFEAAGADLKRLRLLDPVNDDLCLPVRNLAQDLRRLRDELLAPSTLIVIDYFSEYIQSGCVEASVSCLRPAIEEMKRMAEEHRLSIVLPCRIPSRDDRDLAEAINELRCCSEIDAVLRVEHIGKANRGVLVPVEDSDPARGYSFRVNQYDGAQAVEWQSVLAADLPD